MRMSRKTTIAINIIAGEYQTQTGKSYSTDKALWAFIAKHAPQIAERAEQMSGEPDADEPSEDDSKQVA